MLNRIVKTIFGDPMERAIAEYQPRIDAVTALEPEYEALSDEQLAAKTLEFRKRLAAGETLDDILVEAFATVREAGKRTIGQRHYDVQLLGGIVLHEGRIAEMKTGEGKTLVATLPLYLNALLGRGAHLVTPNDYLSKYGLQTMGFIYHFLGLSAGVIQNTGGQPDTGSYLFDPDYSADDDRYQNLRPCSRRDAYHADITYGTNNEFGFDYLRNNMVLDPERLSQRDLYFAVVDEVDNILIDEARTPLIISGPADKPSEYYKKFTEVVRQLRRSSDESVDAEEPDADYVLDEKDRIVFLTEAGVDHVEKLMASRGMLNNEELYHPDNSEMMAYLDNCLRAKALFQNDQEYVVQEGQVVIVDEFTGRMMPGRRFSEGLHQAIEAKENVEVRRENMTLATITFQNFFRMYEKLAGMTGTALTEQDEFEKIYDLDVIVIPTNLPIQRADENDLIYVSERAKWNAVVNEIKARSENGQPILVGTKAIETSQVLSKMLSKASIKHNVLNAKQHEREASIIAQAGRPGAVTIATNMAGRGVDILLGGNPEGLARDYLREDGIDVTEATDEQWQAALARARQTTAEHRDRVLNAGGLYVLGTERHDARRIDNQLRGRSGRQGDPGESRFFLSLEDDLIRRFNGEQVKRIMGWANLPEDEPLEHGMVSKSIEQAQIKVEGHNFDIRKRVLDYDDVVNRQREIIYNQRKEWMDKGADALHEDFLDLILAEISATMDHQAVLEAGIPFEQWDFEALYKNLLIIFPVPEHINPDSMADMTLDELDEALQDAAEEILDRKREEMEAAQPGLMAHAERITMLRAIDTHWQRHLTALDVLREGIGLMSIAQRDPLVEYQREAFMMFEELQGAILEMAIRNIYLVQPAVARQPVQQRQMTAVRASSSGEDTSVQQTVRKTEKPGRNDPCWCGSGKKYKHCHYKLDKAEVTQMA